METTKRFMVTTFFLAEEVGNYFRSLNRKTVEKFLKIPSTRHSPAAKSNGHWTNSQRTANAREKLQFNQSSNFLKDS